VLLKSAPLVPNVKAATDVTVPDVIVGKVANEPSPLRYCKVVPDGVLNLPLKISQSLESKYPLVVPSAALIDRLGVAPPVDDIGKVAVTLVTVPPDEGAELVIVKLG
jgi:hypothetical protein